MLSTRSSRLLKTTTNRETQRRIAGFHLLQQDVESARFVLHGRPEAFARWLAIWAEEYVPQFMEVLNEYEFEKPLYWSHDAADGDIPRSEVFV